MFASIWLSIREAIADIEGVLLSVVWVPAHISVCAAIARGASGLHRRAGNRWADSIAKAGAGLHPDRLERRTRAARIQEVLLEIVPFFGAGLACLVVSSLLPVRPPASRLGRLPRLRTHLVVEVGEGGSSPVLPLPSGRQWWWGRPWPLLASGGQTSPLVLHPGWVVLLRLHGIQFLTYQAHFQRLSGTS